MLLIHYRHTTYVVSPLPPAQVTVRQSYSGQSQSQTTDLVVILANNCHLSTCKTACPVSSGHCLLNRTCSGSQLPCAKSLLAWWNRLAVATSYNAKDLSSSTLLVFSLPPISPICSCARAFESIDLRSSWRAAHLRTTSPEYQL